jgi:Ca2+-binding RTX toxin-like protein
MQPLESRRLLSGTVMVGSHGVLHVTLDNHANTVSVGYSDLAGSAIVVDINGVDTTIPQTGAGAEVVKDLVIHCGGGSDNVSITPGDGSTIKDWGLETVIRCGGGSDTVTTGNENDLIFGGAGHDTITAGNGNDSIFGGAGNNDITVGSGNDIIMDGGSAGLHGNCSITAAGGNDTLFGLAGDDVINTGNGATVNVFAGSGDTVNAGTGDDTVYVAGKAKVDVNGSATVTHVRATRAAQHRFAAYFRAIKNAEAQAAEAANY